MKETKKLTFAEIQALSPAERFAFMADGVKLGKKVEETRDTYKKVSPWYAKLVAALKRDHARFKDEKSIPADQTFKQFYAKNSWWRIARTAGNAGGVFQLHVSG